MRSWLFVAATMTALFVLPTGCAVGDPEEEAANAGDAGSPQHHRCCTR